MNESVSGFTVYTSKKGYICISQDDVGDGTPIIIIHPSQVPILTTWLNSAVAEITRNENEKQRA